MRRIAPKMAVNCAGEGSKPFDFVPTEVGEEYRKIDGILYLHEFAEVEVMVPVFLRGSFDRWNSKKRVVSQLKRQLGKEQ